MSPLVLILVSMLAMSGIIAVRYLLSSGGFALATRARAAGTLRGPDKSQIGCEIRWSPHGAPSSTARLRGLVAWGWQNRGWTQIYTDVHAFPLWYLPVSVLLYLAAHDTWFYWTHRLMHCAAWWFRVAHAVHHDSRPPTAWAAMSFHPWEALTGAVVIPALVFLIPIHVAALGIGTRHHDGDGGDQSYGLGDVLALAGAWARRGVAHHRPRITSVITTATSAITASYFRVWDRLSAARMMGWGNSR